MLYRISDESQLVPPPLLMLEEADEVLEEWFAGGAEQSTLLRTLACVGYASRVLEVGCGLGRLAFALRRVLSKGCYLGLDVVPEKIDFLRERMSPAYPGFRFEWLDIRSDFYHPHGSVEADEVDFPCPEGWADAVVSMSVFTHLLPGATERYLSEIARTLRPGGFCLLSVFILDYYRPEHSRPAQFFGAPFDFDHPVAGTGGEVHTSDPTCAEAMVAMRSSLLRELVGRSGLRFARDPLPGMWSGSHAHWTTGQDLVLLRKP